MLKNCVICGEEFQARGTAKTCCKEHRKDLRRENERKQRAANREKVNADARKRRAANIEKFRAYERKWRAANIEKARRRERKWRAANIEKARAQKRKHYFNNKEKYLAWDRRNRMARSIWLANGIVRAKEKGAHHDDC